MADVRAEVTDLIQRLIRNRCVNDGTPDSGGEYRNADLLLDYLGTSGFDLETFEPHRGRKSIVARIEGSDPTAPSLMFCGHTDVVPVNEASWRHDPFGGEIHDGFIWGRGAVDMLNLTSSMAVAFKHLADTGFRPKGDLIYFAVADEEAGGVWGAKHLVANEPDAVRADYVLTEYGGAQFPMSGGVGPRLPVTIAEKGPFWASLRISGTPGHGSMPLRTDNAIVTAAEVVRRLDEFEPPAVIHEVWRDFVDGLDLPPAISSALTTDAGLRGFATNADIGLARLAHACTHNTIAPTMLEAGTKVNIIPDSATVHVDIRALPGEDADSIREMLTTALGDLAPSVEIQFDFAEPATSSPMDTPLWDVLARHAAKLIPGSVNVPFMVTGATDARFLRELGAVAYGFGMYTDALPFDDFAAMFHGDDERIDPQSLVLSTELWTAVAKDLLQ